MSYLELFKIISRPWASIKEIRLIANCGRDSAIKIRNDIENIITSEGKILPTGKTIMVPMKYVVEYLGLDLKHITAMANYELYLINNENNRASNHTGLPR